MYQVYSSNIQDLTETKLLRKHVNFTKIPKIQRFYLFLSLQKVPFVIFKQLKSLYILSFAYLIINTSYRNYRCFKY